MTQPPDSIAPEQKARLVPLLYAATSQDPAARLGSLIKLSTPPAVRVAASPRVADAGRYDWSAVTDVADIGGNGESAQSGDLRP